MTNPAFKRRPRNNQPPTTAADGFQKPRVKRKAATHHLKPDLIQEIYIQAAKEGLPKGHMVEKMAEEYLDRHAIR